MTPRPRAGFVGWGDQHPARADATGQALTSVPCPPIPSLHPRNRPGQQQDQCLLLAGGGLVVEEVPGPDVLGGKEGAAEGKRRDVP